MQCGEQTQLTFSFQLCLDFSRLRIYCKAEKENGVTARRSSLPLSERLSAKSPHFLFSDLELEALSLEKRGRTGSRNGVCKGHSLCPSESALPLMLMKLAKSMSRVLWRYCWHNSKNTATKGNYTYERKTHFPLSRQGKPYSQQSKVQRQER